MIDEILKITNIKRYGRGFVKPKKHVRKKSEQHRKFTNKKRSY